MSARTRVVAGIAIGLLVLTAATERWMGRLPLGPDGRFGWWEGNIWSSAQSQRVSDPYSFSHVVHGLLFYGLFWIVRRRARPSSRFLAAVGLEVGWEILENSPIIINRYRETTIALGYVGDSVLNSVSDVVMMSLGYLIASRAKVVTAIAIILVFELGMLFAVRDNLTLNIIMLVYPIDAIREWQMAARPPGF